jgi:hypothetical protein
MLPDLSDSDLDAIAFLSERAEPTRHAPNPEEAIR